MKKYIIPQAKVYKVNSIESLLAGSTSSSAPSSVSASVSDTETNVQLSKENSSFDDEE